MAGATYGASPRMTPHSSHYLQMVHLTDARRTSPAQQNTPIAVCIHRATDTFSAALPSSPWFIPIQHLQYSGRRRRAAIDNPLLCYATGLRPGKAS